MSCIINEGWSLGCRDNTGGIQEFYIKSFSSTQSYTYDINGKIGTASTAETFYRIEQVSETGEFLQNGQHSPENGTNFWEQDANMVFHKYQASVRDLVYVLAQKELLILAKDQNGKVFMIGEQNGANLVASTANVGKAYGDMNGATVGFKAKEPSPARECSASYLASITIV